MMNYLSNGGDFHKYDAVKSKKILGSHPEAPKYSIMIPTYKRPNFLAQSISSALAQKEYNDFEIVIVDNDAKGETEDETIRVIKSFASDKIIYYRNSENIGIYGNTLRAAQLSKGRYVVLLNDDDLLHPFYLKTINMFMEKYNYKGIVGSKPYDFRGNDLVFPDLISEIWAYRVTKREFFFGCCVTSPGFMYPREILEDIYNAHEELLMGDQIIQYKGLSKYGLTFIDYPLAAYRISDNATCKNDVLSRMIIDMCAFRKQTSAKDLVLSLFMKNFEKEYYYWYMNSNLEFWKKRGLRKQIIEDLNIKNINKWSIKIMLVGDLIGKIHAMYLKKHIKNHDFINVEL